MKKAITFTLIAILFLGLFAGCNTYTRPVVHGTDGARVTRGFQYRDDGYVTDGGTTRHARGTTDGGTARHAHVRDGLRDGHHAGNTLHHFRYGGHGTSLDGRTTNRGLNMHSATTDPNVLGNSHYGSGAMRPAVDGAARSAAR